MLKARNVLSVFMMAVLVSLGLITTAPVPVFGATDELGFSLSYERFLEEKLRTVLADIIGNDRIIVIVNAEVKSSEGDVAGSRGSLTKRQSDAVVLPGVPMKKELGREQTSEIVAPVGSSKLSTKRLVVTLLMEDSVSDTLKEVLSDVATRVVGLSKTRGDELIIKQIGFRSKKFYWSSIFYPPQLYWFILSIVGAFFLVAGALFLLNPYVKLFGSQTLKSDSNMRENITGETHSSGASGEPLAMTQTLAPLSAAVSQERESIEGAPERPFSFIREQHLRDLSFLLKKEPAMDVAIIVNYLGSDLAMKLLDLFPGDKQADITVCLSEIEEVSHEKINQLESKIRGRLGYLIGGEDKMANLLDMASDEVRERVFGLMEKKNATAAKSLRQKVKDIETIMREISTQGVQVIYRHMDATLFAQILKSFPEDIQQKVSGSLTAGAAERLQQEIDLSRPLAPTRLKIEKQTMMQLIRRLIKEGLLEMEKN